MCACANLTYVQIFYSPSRQVLCWAGKRRVSERPDPSCTSVLAKTTATFCREVKKRKDVRTEKPTFWITCVSIIMFIQVNIPKGMSSLRTGRVKKITCHEQSWLWGKLKQFFLYENSFEQQKKCALLSGSSGRLRAYAAAGPEQSTSGSFWSLPLRTTHRYGLNNFRTNQSVMRSVAFCKFCLIHIC